MKHHSDLINFIIKQKDLKSYVEIGTFNRSHNFDLIQCEKKYCVDPDPNAKADFLMTSDAFFEFIQGKKYDIFFIDGLHHADQVRVDIINAWECLNYGGVIVVHDANPHSEEITQVPRSTREWTGDVYIAVSQITSKKITIDFDYGCCVLTKENDKLEFTDRQISWDEFDKNRKTLLNLVSEDRGKKIIESWNQPIDPEYIG